MSFFAVDRRQTDISLYLVEWRTCAVIRLHDRHAPATHLWITCSHWDGSPIMRPWYYLQRRISAGAKFPSSPHLKLSHRGGCGELAQDPCMQTAAWKRLLVTGKNHRRSIMAVWHILYYKTEPLVLFWEVKLWDKDCITQILCFLMWFFSPSFTVETNKHKIHNAETL